MSTRSVRSRICLDIGNMSPIDACHLVAQFGPLCHAIRISEEFDTKNGDLIDRFERYGAHVWVDTRILHSSPVQAARQALEIANLGARTITVQSCGETAMMQAVKNILALNQHEEVDVFATISPSAFDPAQGAGMAKEARVDGIVCSPQQIRRLFNHPNLGGMQFIVDMTLSSHGECMTSQEVIYAGASFIVVGSQVTEATDPEAAFHTIIDAIGMHS